MVNKGIKKAAIRRLFLCGFVLMFDFRDEGVHAFVSFIF